MDHPTDSRLDHDVARGTDSLKDEHEATRRDPPRQGDHVGFHIAAARDGALNATEGGDIPDRGLEVGAAQHLDLREPEQGGLTDARGWLVGASTRGGGD